MDVNTESTAKSIVNAKYRNKYKGDKDWLAKLLDAEATKAKTVKVTKVVGDEKVISEETRADGVDIPALFVLAEKNGLNVDTYRGQEGNHGFAGRFRMTVRNMLQRVVKQRHGLFNKGGTFVSGPGGLPGGDRCRGSAEPQPGRLEDRQAGGRAGGIRARGGSPEEGQGQEGRCCGRPCRRLIAEALQRAPSSRELGALLCPIDTLPLSCYRRLGRLRPWDLTPRPGHLET
jgi:hypothetical protein